MNEPLILEKEGAEVENRNRSYLRYKKIKDVVDKASDNGRCWWIAQYLRNTLKY
jgi:hypothetical protein